MLVDLLDDFLRLPRIAAPDFVDLAVLVYQCGRKPMRNGAAFGLHVNGKGVRERINVRWFAGSERPDLWVGILVGAVFFQDRRPIECGIERDTEQPRLCECAATGLDGALQVGKIVRHAGTEVWQRATCENEGEHEGLASKCVERHACSL